MEIDVAYRGRIVVTPSYEGEKYDEAAVIEKAFDDTLEALHSEASVMDPSVSGAIATGEIEIACTVAASSPADAIKRAEKAVRAALKAAGVGTSQLGKIVPDIRPPHMHFEWHRTELGEAA